VRKFRYLAWSSWLEMIRDPLVTGMSVVFPLCFLVMFVFMPDLPSADGTVVSAFTFGLPAVLLFAMIVLGLTGTAGPMVTQRKDGILRNVGMTPTSPLTYLLAQVPGRLVVEMCEVLLIGIIAGATGSLHVTNIPFLLLALGLSMLCTISIGLLLGATSRNASLIGALGGLLAPVLLMVCGVLLPFSIFPDQVEIVARFLPFTYLGDMLRHSLVGLPLDYSPALGACVCLAYGLVMMVVTPLVFRWSSRSRKLQ